MPHSDGLSTIVIEDSRPGENSLSFCYVIETKNRFNFLEEIHKQGPFDSHNLSFENFLEQCIQFNIINSYKSSQMFVNSNVVFLPW